MMLTVRSLLRNPIQAALMILSISLGVAVIVSIDIANASAERAFNMSTSAIAGRTTHHILAGQQGVDEDIYVSLRTDPHWRNTINAAPLIKTYALILGMDDTPFTLLGIDPFAEAPFRNYLTGQQDFNLGTLLPLLTQPGAIFLFNSTAQRFGIEPCKPFQVNASCSLTIRVNGVESNVFLAGTLDPEDEFARRTLENIIVTDISTAQSLTGMSGKLSQIDLILPETFDPAVLSASLPDGTALVSSDTRTSQISAMTTAFKVNLTALSLLALVVGVFLIYNTMTFSVVQRRSLFGTLRSIGYTREQVFGMVLSESALVGAIGSILGIGLGIVLGKGSVQMVTQTINDLFFVLTVRDVQLSASSILKGGLSGLFASLLAAAMPAWEAASIPPRMALSRANLENKAQFAMNWAAILGVVAVLGGAASLFIPTRNLTFSFISTSVIIIGLAGISPTVTAWFMRLTSAPLSRIFGLLGRLSTRNVIRSQSRTAVAVAALMIAVGVTIGVQVMIVSFRTTVTLWLEETLQGDIYITGQSSSTARLETPLDAEVVSRLQNYPGIATISSARVVMVETQVGPVEMLATSSNPPMDARLFLVTQGSSEETWQKLKDGEILLSEPLANRLQITRAGGDFSLLTPQGWKKFRIAGIYSDYASSNGRIRMNLDVYRKIWQDDRVNGLALYLPPGLNVNQVTAELRSQLSGFPGIEINPSIDLRQNALEVFDRTFAITTAMQFVTTLVAFIGVLSSLLALQLEKSSEMGILRALGLTVAQMRRLTLLETGLLGASAGLLAFPTGYILAWILIYIINQRSFGWTLQMQITYEPFLQAFLLAIGSALLAAIYPAWRLSHQQTSKELREE